MKEADKPEREVTVVQAVNSNNTAQEKKATAAPKRGKEKVNVEN